MTAAGPGCPACRGHERDGGGGFRLQTPAGPVTKCFPCAVRYPPLIRRSAVIADTVRQGVGLLAAYSAGLGTPFLLSAVALGVFLKFFRRYRPFIPLVERFAGVCS